MHDLDLVAFGDDRNRPVGPAYDLFVVLDGDALARQGKNIEQPVKRDLAFDTFPFTVQRNLH